MVKFRVLWLKLGIRQKLAAILIGVLAPLLAAMVIQVVITTYVHSLQEQHHHLLLAREQLHILHRFAIDIEDAFRGYVLTREDRFLEPMKEAETQLQSALDKIRNLTSRVEDLKDTIAEIKERLTGSVELKQALIQRMHSGNHEEALQDVKSKEGIQVSDDVRDQLRLLEDRLVQQLHSTEIRHLWVARVAFWGLLGAAAGGIGLGYLAIRLFDRSIAGPLTALYRSARESGTNDVEGTGLGHMAGHSSDEIGQLAYSYLDMSVRVRRQIGELHALSSIGQEINSMYPDVLEGVLQGITNHAQKLLQVDLSLIMLKSDQMGCWIVEAASGIWHERLNKSVMLWQEFPLSVQAFETKQPVVGEDLSRDVGPEIRRRNQFGQSMLSIPLLSQGAAFGVMVFMHEQKRPRQKWNMVLAQAFADAASIAIVHARLYETTSQEGRDVQSRIRELQHLAENLAHDVKAPGERIQGLASLLKADPGSQLSEEGIHWLALIDVYGKELRKRAEHILALARIGSSSIAVEAVDPAVIIEEVLKLRSSEIEQCGARIDVQMAPPLVACHEAYLRQVFDNVISNAVKFSSGRKNPVIGISWEQQKEHIHFKVSDNGPGIPPEDHERIFAPFVRLNPDETAGSGIGLTIVRRIIELYGGRVWVDSRVGNGCSVIFSMPALGDLGPVGGEPLKWTYGSL